MGRALLLPLLFSRLLVSVLSGQASLDVDLRAAMDGRYSRYLGAFGNGKFGVPVCGGHDCDGDGQLDSAFASISASTSDRSAAGIVTVVWGRAGSFGESLDTLVLDERTLRIGGTQAFEVCGAEIWMDDVDGDGLGDILIGRQNFSPTAARRWPRCR